MNKNQELFFQKQQKMNPLEMRTEIDTISYYFNYLTRHKNLDDKKAVGNAKDKEIAAEQIQYYLSISTYDFFQSLDELIQKEVSIDDTTKDLDKKSIKYQRLISNHVNRIIQKFDKRITDIDSAGFDKNKPEDFRILYYRIKQLEEKESEVGTQSRLEKKYPDLVRVRESGLDTAAVELLIAIDFADSHNNINYSLERFQNYSTVLDKSIKAGDQKQLDNLLNKNYTKRFYDAYRQLIINIRRETGKQNALKVEKTLSVAGAILSEVIKAKELSKSAQQEAVREAVYQKNPKLKNKEQAKRITEAADITRVENFLKEVLPVLEKRDVKSLVNTWVVLDDSPLRWAEKDKATHKFFSGDSAHPHCSGLVKTLLKERENWFICKNKNVLLVLPLKYWKDKLGMRSAVRLMWIEKEKRWRLGPASPFSYEIRNVVEFK